jgi:hypothetical protein
LVLVRFDGGVHAIETTALMLDRPCSSQFKDDLAILLGASEADPLGSLLTSEERQQFDCFLASLEMGGSLLNEWVGVMQRGNPSVKLDKQGVMTLPSMDQALNNLNGARTRGDIEAAELWATVLASQYPKFITIGIARGLGVTPIPHSDALLEKFPLAPQPKATK